MVAVRSDGSRFRFRLEPRTARQRRPQAAPRSGAHDLTLGNSAVESRQVEGDSKATTATAPSTLRPELRAAATILVAEHGGATNPAG